MELKEVRCTNCGKDFYVLDDRTREKMFCTLGCMNKFNNNIQGTKTKNVITELYT